MSIRNPLSVFVMSAVLLLQAAGSFADCKGEACAAERRKGLEIGAVAGAFVGSGRFADTSVGGKLDVMAGYRFHPQIALFADVWTVNFVVAGFELNPRFHFLSGRWSPFVTLGIGFSTTNAGDSDLSGLALTYDFGAGLDWRFKEKQVLQFTVKYFDYRGANAPITTLRNGGKIDAAVDIGIGYRWLF